eukprot:CAMPEP_0180133122 /NCGR_PEP_ID=MMETSP0986-20121125/9363_1 /TAXON_ID=697907 /ORGANISM="non described non described, Strain CCMP2293" /LENGTH=134 /DNA_ID=CAMNT_0022073201 /DNA_START=143 /DNA_END=545 /DNA_ORIENTATION=+
MMHVCLKRILAGVRWQIRIPCVRQTSTWMSYQDGLSHTNRSTIPRCCTPQRGNSQTQNTPSSPSRAAPPPDAPLAVMVLYVPDPGVLLRDQAPLAHPNRRCAGRAAGTGAAAAQPRQVVHEEVPRPARAAPALL